MPNKFIKNCKSRKYKNNYFCYSCDYFDKGIAFINQCAKYSHSNKGIVNLVIDKNVKAATPNPDFDFTELDFTEID